MGPLTPSPVSGTARQGLSRPRPARHSSSSLVQRGDVSTSRRNGGGESSRFPRFSNMGNAMGNMKNAMGNMKKLALGNAMGMKKLALGNAMGNINNLAI